MILLLDCRTYLDIYLHYLTDIIMTCVNMLQIDLSNNVIKKYTKNMYKLPVTLDMSRNKLKKLTPPKMKVPLIHHLDVSYNQVV